MRLWIPIALAALLAAGCGKAPPKGEAVRPAIVRKVALGAPQQLAVYSGEVRARHEADRAFRVGGKLVERRVNLGDQVKKGEVLARLDPRDVELNSAAARAQVAAAEADLKLARTEFDRAQALADRNFLSGSVVDQRRTAVTAAEARLKQALSQADVASNQTGYATLTADRDGVVTAVLAEAGQVVQAGQAVVRVAEAAEREVLMYVPEKRIDEVKPGARAVIRPWANPQTMLPGVVREVAAAADTATRTFAVRVALTQTQTDEALPLGGTAAVVLPGGLNDGVVLPLGAVVQRNGAEQVWVVGADGAVQPRRVAVLAYREDGVLVKGELADGEQVVVVGAHTLVQGARVRPVPEAAPVALDAKR